MDLSSPSVSSLTSRYRVDAAGTEGETSGEAAEAEPGASQYAPFVDGLDEVFAAGGAEFAASRKQGGWADLIEVYVTTHLF